VIYRRLLIAVNHKILLDKLEFYGIGGILKTLFKSYLTGRSQRVVLGNINNSNNTSKWEIIKHGVCRNRFLDLCFSYFTRTLMIYPKYYTITLLL
jgi:hypothetical protein